MITKSHRRSHSAMQKQFDFDPVEQQYVNEQVELDGVIVSCQVVKEVNLAKPYASFMSTDFSLSNQLATGSFAGKPINVGGVDIDSLSDNVSSLETSINKELSDANNSQVQAD